MLLLHCQEKGVVHYTISLSNSCHGISQCIYVDNTVTGKEETPLFNRKGAESG